MKISIIGTGGVGGYFGGKLANAGFDVHFIARGRHLEAMRKNGLVVKSIHGDFVLAKVSASDRMEDIAGSALVILGVKSWQVESIAKEIAPYTGPETTVLPLQNGVLAAKELAMHIGKENILNGICRIFSQIESPGVICHFAVEPAIIFGECDNRHTSRIDEIKAMFDTAGFASKIPDDIDVELWKKFIAICSSALLALTRSNYGEIRQLPPARRLMRDLFIEIYTLSQKIGIGIESGFVDKTMAFIDSFPPETTSSLTRDVWEGRPSEIEYQNGTVVRLGEQYGVPTPINRFIYECILPMEVKHKAQDKIQDTRFEM